MHASVVRRMHITSYAYSNISMDTVKPGGGMDRKREKRARKDPFDSFHRGDS